MKKFIGSFFIFIIVIFASIASVPWNDLTQWGISYSIITTYEVYIKAGIFVLALLFSFIYLLVANAEYKKNGVVSKNTARTAFLPIYVYSISILVFGAAINYYVYLLNDSTTNLLIVGFFGFIVLNLIIFGHIVIYNFKKVKTGKRMLYYFFLIELAVFSLGITFWFYTYKVTNYSGFNSKWFAGTALLGILIYLIDLFFNKKLEEDNFEDLIENELSEMNNPAPKPKRRGKKHQELNVAKPKQDNKKTLIVSSSQTIVSGEQNIDPTNLIYEDVSVDPEFTKTNPVSTSPNSIEYYIEKPKMFRPLDPTFDALVAYVRELPQVVTKLDDDRITFYVDRKPFLVVMNFGNYYRLAFKYDLEKGIRLIIKYPTISKNKSTRDELWFKANNYGDIPKDVIYQIVKTAYNSINL